MTKKIILCADDYGQNNAISRGILELLARKRLSAVSCLTTPTNWLMHAKELLAYESQVDIGLHFNLTEGVVPLSRLLFEVYTGQLKREKLIQVLHRQLDLFVDAMGKLPDFIDGHQHVHQLPIVRDALLDVYHSRLKTRMPYIRYVNVKNKMKLKNLMIYLLGSRGLERKLEKFSIPHNQSFSGIYNFSHAENYAKIFPLFLTEIQHGGLIMCHPGLSNNDANDAIAYGREFEYQYFLSDQFIADCQHADVEITRFCNTNL